MYTQIITQLWMTLPKEERDHIAAAFNLSRTGITEIRDQEVITDGYTNEDLKAITLEKMTEYIGSEETFMRAWEITVMKTHSELNPPRFAIGGFPIQQIEEKVQEIAQEIKQDVEKVVKKIEYVIKKEVHLIKDYKQLKKFRKENPMSKFINFVETEENVVFFTNDGKEEAVAKDSPIAKELFAEVEANRAAGIVPQNPEPATPDVAPVAPDTTVPPVDMAPVTPADTAPVTPPANPETPPVETVEHTLTQEDLDVNPQLVAQGAKVGDIIHVPKDELPIV